MSYETQIVGEPYIDSANAEEHDVRATETVEGKPLNAAYFEEHDVRAIEVVGTQALDADAEPSVEDALAFQAKLWALLDRRVALFTSGESSSVPHLIAHEMLASVLYVLGVDLDDLSPSVLHRLARADLDTEFERGLKQVKAKADRATELWKEAVLSTPLLESIALRDTLNGIDTFLGSYDYRYFAAKAECDIDYPLCDPVSEDMQGIDYVCEYLDRLVQENAFMAQFKLADMKALLKRVSPEYKELIINLFEPVATNAIGLALVSDDVRKLNVSDEQREKIAQEFTGLSAAAAKRKLQQAAADVCKQLRIKDVELQGYLEKLAVSLHSRIKAVSATGGLTGVFLEFKR